MATEVKHGPKPRFKAKLQRGSYALSLRGYYTHTDHLTAAGVTHFQFHSQREVKRKAEALGMRTAFVCWFMEQYVTNGGSWAEATRAFVKYPFNRLRKKFLKEGKIKKRGRRQRRK